MSSTPPGASRVPASIYVLVILGVLGALVGVAALGVRYFHGRSEERMRVVLRNATGSPLTGVSVTATYAGNPVPPDLLSSPALAPGAELSFRPRTNDIRVVVSCFSGGTRMTVSSLPIDLWAGESFLLEIQPDGTLGESYVDPRRTSR